MVDTKPKKWKFKTGFCSEGQHEGTRPVSRSGQPMKICEFWEQCPCKCHTEITAMYEMAGIDREPPEQTPEYLAKVHAQEVATSKMLDEVYAMTSRSRSLSNVGGTDAHPDHERPVATPPSAAHGPSAPPPRPMFAHTPTGRRARGQLEYDVLAVCDEYSRDVYDWEYCTPKLVAERIGRINDTEPPSTGAINAVWDRWEKLDFAVQAKKPSRFVEFKIDGSAQTLDMIKSRSKRQKKMSQAELRRGIPRPKRR
jgi:hypothetical protein